MAELTTRFTSQPTITALDVAAYYAAQYQLKFRKRIDEMKLHKLLYFAQREYILEQGTPLFADIFEAWKHGPLLTSVRYAYKTGDIFSREVPVFSEDVYNALNYVFDTFASKSSWTLSSLTHREVCWRNARKGIPDGANGSCPISTEDIRIDAERFRHRKMRVALQEVLNDLH